MTAFLANSNQVEDELSQFSEQRFTNSLMADIGANYGFEIADKTVDLDDYAGAVIRSESGLDLLDSTVIFDATNETPGAPDVDLTPHGGLVACWATVEGHIKTYSRDLTGLVKSTYVDSVASVQSSDDLTDCAISVKENSRITLLYADGPDLKAAQIAYASPLYANGDDWHTRTILEDVYPTSIELDVTPNQLEWGVFRNQQGQLIQVNYSGAFWQTNLLDNGPVGTDIELKITNNGDKNIFFTKGNDALMLTVSNQQTTLSTVDSNIDLNDQIAFALDNNDLFQVASSSFDGAESTISFQRSLINNKNQISAYHKNQITTSWENSTASVIEHGDFNGDGIDDIVVAQGDADAYYSGSDTTTTGIDNGVVSVFYGSVNGLPSTADASYYGEQDEQFLGQAIAVADFDGDGYDDLAVGSPGINSQDGRVDLVYGSQTGLASVLSSNEGLTPSVGQGDEFGSCLEPILDLSGDGKDELIVCSYGYSSGSDNGLVQLFSGDTNFAPWALMNSPEQSLQGGIFGRSVSADGDINGDGFNDLVIGNTNTLESNTGYASVEIFFGGVDGFGPDYDDSFQSIFVGTLFGYHVQIVEDMNGDSFDEVLISEPYNSSNPFQSGDVWYFLGNNSGLNNEPDYRIIGQANDLIGINFLSAGDSNQDGFNDLLMVKRGVDVSGSVELYLGSPDGFESTSHTIVSGGNMIGMTSTANCDVDGDGVVDYLFSQQITDTNNAVLTTFKQHYRELWEYSNLTINGELQSLELESSVDGNPTFLLSTRDSTGDTIVLLEKSRQPTGETWLLRNLTKDGLNPISAGFTVSSSGNPMIITADHNNGVVLKEYSSYTALENIITTSFADASHLSSALSDDDMQHFAYYSATSSDLYLASETQSGWSEQIIRSGVNIDYQISLLINSSGEHNIVYRNSGAQNIEFSSYNGGWITEILGAPGSAISPSFDSLVLPNDDIIVATIIDDGLSKNLSLLTWNGTESNVSFIAYESDVNSQISLSIGLDGTVIVSSINSQGVLLLYEQAAGQGTWNSIMLQQPIGFGSTIAIDSYGGANPVIAVNSNQNSIHIKSNGVWESLADSPPNHEGSIWQLEKTSNHLILYTNNSNSNELIFNSLELNGDDSNSDVWLSQKLAMLGTSPSFTSNVVDDNLIKSVAVDSNLGLVKSLRFYLDSDGDMVMDVIDQIPQTPNQWYDSDGDGYGDNILGPMPDSCPNESRTSSLGLLGCNDFDLDGYDDLTDECTSFGLSWLDRKGCSDFDQDGWSDYNSNYKSGDIFSDNWKQAFDSDGDSYGDNHGPDCCDTWYDTNAAPGDEFPYDYKQYTDYDKDGYGDNSSDLIDGDACKYVFGTSFRDRLGCPDTDGDGSSDPSGIWDESLGADLWPNDPTQWTDSDGDGFGDNSSQNATNPDSFPNNIAAVLDTDGDGYPDEFTEFYNGSNSGGLYLDGCPQVFGNSSNPLFGCLDTDGDNFMDTYTYDINPETGLRENENGDAFPLIPDQWSDQDGDGFGDFQNGYQADACPQIPGVINGTFGIGCKIIDGNDDDLDSVINEDDICPDTDSGKSVDLNGCADNQLDDDDDGVFNDKDLCPQSPPSSTVDSENGCTQEQYEVDSDNDGLFDIIDTCPDTPSGETVNEQGCSASQADSDGDGVYDNVDQCPDTVQGYNVDAVGCADESNNNEDTDLDGYKGIYQYDIDEAQGIRVNQSGDLYPNDVTQWWDTDGDGYGDNTDGTNGDTCMFVSGSSFADRFGCLDTDGDGWSDPTADWFGSPTGLADGFPQDSTQWRDADGDGYGDNSSGNNPDLCPNTNAAYRTSVDLNGCAENERDSDSDGIVDSLDNCPFDAKGDDGYPDGCPLETNSDTNEASGLFGVSTLNIVIFIVVILVAIIAIVRYRNRIDDDDWFDDDEDDDYYEDEPLSFLDSMRSNNSNQAPTPPVKGPTKGPPSRGFSQTPKGPPKQSNPSPRYEPSTAPPALRTYTAPRNPQKSAKKIAKKVKAGESNSGNKVKRAVVQDDEDIFERVDSQTIDYAVMDVISYFDENLSERQILMNLQENGWNAPQSRMLINMAKKKTR